MFYKTTFLLIMCNFATVLALPEFGCEFRNTGYAVRKPGKGILWPEAVWGKNPTPPLLVGSNADLTLFQAKIQDARKKVFQEYVFDQARPFSSFIFNMPDDVFHGKGSREFRKWWADYQPTLKGRKDELGYMMLIMNQLSEYCKGTNWANVKNSSFFAAVRKGVDYKEIKKLDDEETSQAPKEKDIKELIGVIHVIVDSVPGYILIDLDFYFMDGALFIQNPRDHKTQFATVKSPFSMENKHVTINIIGQDKAFLHLLIDSGNATSNPSSSGGPANRMNIVPSNQTPAQNEPPPMSKVIYVERPLCSILRTANNMMRYNPVITYGKLNAQGDMLAYVLTRFPEAKDFDSPFCKSMDSQDTFCAGYLKTDESTNEKKLVERTLSSFQNMSRDDREFIQIVAHKMASIQQFPVYEEIKMKMTELDKYMIKYKTEEEKKRLEGSTNSSWNSVKLQAAKIKDKLPSLCGLGKV